MQACFPTLKTSLSLYSLSPEVAENDCTASNFGTWQPNACFTSNFVIAAASAGLGVAVFSTLLILSYEHQNSPQKE
jgi:hypothetical protein